MARRIILDILLFLSIFILPFWLTVILAIACLFLFDSFYEIIPVFLFIDLLYGASEDRYFGFTVVSLLAALLLVVITNSIKKKLRR